MLAWRRAGRIDSILTEPVLAYDASAPSAAPSAAPSPAPSAAPSAAPAAAPAAAAPAAAAPAAAAPAAAPPPGTRAGLDPSSLDLAAGSSSGLLDGGAHRPRS